MYMYYNSLDRNILGLHIELIYYVFGVQLLTVQGFMYLKFIVQATL